MRIADCGKKKLIRNPGSQERDYVKPGVRDQTSVHRAVASRAIETRGLPTLTRSYFTLITRTAPCLRQLPSCVAVYPRD
jgi:hypothetical protein